MAVIFMGVLLLCGGMALTLASTLACVFTLRFNGLNLTVRFRLRQDRRYSLNASMHRGNAEEHGGGVDEAVCNRYP
jgi:hypothetical protein